MKIDITPSELKSIIKSYEVELANLDKQYSDLEEKLYTYMLYIKTSEEDEKKKLNISKRMVKIESRLTCLKMVYKDLLGQMRFAYWKNGFNGIRDQYRPNDLSIEDAVELLNELESLKERSLKHD